MHIWFAGRMRGAIRGRENRVRREFDQRYDLLVIHAGDAKPTREGLIGPIDISGVPNNPAPATTRRRVFVAGAQTIDDRAQVAAMRRRDELLEGVAAVEVPTFAIIAGRARNHAKTGTVREVEAAHPLDGWTD